jgi:hypothetical protein
MNRRKDERTERRDRRTDITQIKICSTKLILQTFTFISLLLIIKHKTKTGNNNNTLTGNNNNTLTGNNNNTLTGNNNNTLTGNINSNTIMNIAQYMTHRPHHQHTNSIR